MELLVYYALATAAAFCFFLFAVVWQALAAAVRRWHGSEGGAGATGAGPGRNRPSGEHQPGTRHQAA